MRTESPGDFVEISDVNPVELDTALPSKAVSRSPGLMPARATGEPGASRAVIDLPRPTIAPGELLGVPPTPPALPHATTAACTCSPVDEPTGAIARREELCSWMTATSSPTA